MNLCSDTPIRNRTRPQWHRAVALGDACPTNYDHWHMPYVPACKDIRSRHCDIRSRHCYGWRDLHGKLCASDKDTCVVCGSKNQFLYVIDDDCRIHTECFERTCMEQYSSDRSTYIIGGRWAPRGWQVVIRNEHVATFLRREDARAYIRLNK